MQDRFEDAGDVLNIIPGREFELPGEKPYNIIDKWGATFSGIIHVKEDLSDYA